MASKKILVDIMVVDKNATSTIKKTTTAVDGLAKSTQQLTGRTSKNKAESGLNNAILLETSRLASDASYGFQGIANNLGQVVSLLQISSKNSGGFATALKDLGKSLMGVGGVMVGIQLLISFLPQISKRLKEAALEASFLGGVFQDMKDKVDDTSARFEVYIRTLQSSTKGEQEKKDAIHQLNKEFPDFIDNLNKSGVSMKDLENNTFSAKSAIDAYRTSIIKLAKSEAAFNKIRELQAEILDKQIPRQEELIQLGLTEESLMKQKPILISEFTTTEEFAREKTIERLKSEKEGHFAFIKDTDERIQALLKYVDIQVDTNKKEGRSKKDFVAGQLNFDKEIIQSQGRVSASLRKNKDLEIQAESAAAKELAKIRQRDFADRQQQRVNAIKDPKDRAKAQRAADKEIADSRQSLNEYLDQIDKEASRKINERRLEDLDKATSLLEEQLNARLTSQLEFDAAMATNDLNRLEVQRELEEAKTKTVLDNLERQRTAAIVAGEETIGIDQKISNAKEALANSNISFAEKERKTKLEIANYVADAIIAIAGEQSAVGKAVAVAMATMNTYEAVTAALGATPYGPWNIAQAAATAAFGFLQVKKILATKLPVGAGGGGGGGTPSVEAPDFNVVGASETSQLGMALGRTQGEQKVNLVWDDLQNFNNTAGRTVEIAAL